MATVYGGQGVVAGSPIPPGMPGHQDDIGLKYDVDAAKDELAHGPDRARLRQRRPTSRPCRSASTRTPATRSRRAYMQEQWSKNLGVKSELKGETFDQFVVDRPTRRRVLDRPERLGRGLPAPGQLPPRALPEPERQQRRGVQQPRVRRPRGPGRRRAGRGQVRWPSTTRPRSSSSRTPRRSSPAGAISNYEVRPWVKGVIGTGQDSVVIGDLFFENISIAKH